MSNLQSTAKIVKEMLEKFPEARSNDNFLYLKVLEHISKKEGYGFKFMTVQYFLENMRFYGFPPFESVRRTRQKIQVQNPKLKGSSTTVAARAAKEKEYKDYARSNAT